MPILNSTAESGKLFDGRYKLLRPLSSDGGTADVWLALDTNTIDEVFDDNTDNIISLDDTGIKVAIKIYRPQNALDLGEQRFREEFKIVFNCHHTNLVQPINFSISEGIPYLVLPYCQHGSSERLQGKITDKEELWRYISDVSAGMAYLHAFNPTIVHHDIKPANILIDDNKNYAITDFGISSHRGLNTREYGDAQSGTMAYMAPERFKEDYESVPESDIWSFGATLYELITGHVPYGENGGLEQLERNTSFKPLDASVPNDIKRLIADCLSLEPAKRPSAATIHKAAQLQQYPVKSGLHKYMFAGSVVLSVILLFFIFLRKDVETTVPPANEEIYMAALPLLDSPDKTGLQRGLDIMDSLGTLGFIPAIYEQAYVYGWYGDSVSVARKKILDIEIYSDGDEKYLPKSYFYNQKAISLLSRIEEYADADYPEINANALYRLACYYFNPNKIFKTDSDRAEKLLIQALQWADESDDSELADKIKRNLKIIQNAKD